MAEPELPIDEPSDKPRFHPWRDLLARKRREMIVERLIPVAGVTTMVGQPGEGKSTLAIALALSIETGAMFANQLIKPRPVIWIAGEGQEDLRPLYEAWMKQHPAAASFVGGFFDGPLNFFDVNDTDELIAKIKALPPDTPAPLIVTDALADVMDGGDEDRAKDMNKVYGNIWRFVRATRGSFLVIHHAGWEGKREKGSIAIRAKSDIVILVALHAGATALKVTWLKNRRGPKFDDVFFEVKPVVVEGEEVLAVTGNELSNFDIIMNTPVSDLAPDHDLAIKTLRTLGEAGFEQWLYSINRERTKNLSRSLFTPITKDLIRRKTVIHDPKATNTWTDADGKMHKSKGLYRAAESQVVGEGA